VNGLVIAALVFLLPLVGLALAGSPAPVEEERDDG